MLKKFAFALLLMSFAVSQMTFFAARQNAAPTENAEMLELATMLPEADVVMAMDIDRTLNVAAPNLLNDDAQKIEHLKNLLKTIENQIGLNPGVVKQIAAGFKIPPTGTKDILENTEFTAIVRTNVSNANLLDNWSKKMQDILIFNEEKAPTARYIEEFRRFRDFKAENATSEKIKAAVKNLEDARAKTQKLAAAVDALPKISVTPKAVSDFKTENKTLAETINKYLVILKTDTDTQALRTSTIKLLNRWNALAVDDPDRSVRLAAINKEAQAIYPVYKKKIENIRKIENLFVESDGMEEIAVTESADNKGEEVASTGFASIMSSQLDTFLQSLGSLPPAKLKRTAELSSLTESYNSLNSTWSSKLDMMQSEYEVQEFPDITKPESQSPFKSTSKDFYALIKQAQTEQTVGGKRMILIDLAKLDEPLAADAPKTETTNEERKDQPAPKIAIGFLDDKTMTIGTEKNIVSVLTHDANYKNQKAVDMLEVDKNAVFAFAVNSNAVKRISTEIGGAAAKTENSGNSSAMEKFFGGINIYGSINYDNEGKMTNDITMSLGFSTDDTVKSDVAKSMASATKGADADTTYDIAGYQIAKDIFNDLFSSFKAMRASITFKFEKKKIASLIKATPQILDRITAKNTDAANKDSSPKPRRLENVQDVVTTPQIYVDLLKLLSNKIG